MAAGVLRGRHAIAALEGAVEGTGAFKAHAHGDFHHGDLLPDQRLSGCLTAQVVDVFRNPAAEVLVEQVGKPAFAVAEGLRQCVQCQVALVMLLQVGQNILRQRGVLILRYILDAAFLQHQSKQYIDVALDGVQAPDGLLLSLQRQAVECLQTAAHLPARTVLTATIGERLF